MPYLEASVRDRLSQYSQSEHVAMLSSIQDNLDVLSDVNHYLMVYADSDADFREKLANCTFSDSDQSVLQLFFNKISSQPTFKPEDVTRFLNEICDELSLGKGKVFKPIRLACTGYASGPYLPECLSILGFDTLSTRLKLSLS